MSFVSLFHPSGALADLQHLFLLCFQRDQRVVRYCLKALSRSCLTGIVCSPAKLAHHQKRSLRFCQQPVNPHICFIRIQLQIKVLSNLCFHFLPSLELKCLHLALYLLPLPWSSEFTVVSLLTCLLPFKSVIIYFSACVLNPSLFNYFIPFQCLPRGLFR